MPSPKHNSAPKKAQMLKALEESLGVVTIACKKIGIDRNTHYNWINSDPHYKSAVESVNNVVLDFAETHLHKRIKDGSDSALIFLLKCKGKDRGYVEKTEQKIEHSGYIDSRIALLKNASDDDLEKILADE